MTIFGDDEPEDAWDAEDEPEDQVDNLRLRLAFLLAAKARDGDLLAELAILRNVLERIRERRTGEREILRSEQLDEDISFVVARLTD
jgi:hypothetical protein